MADARYDAVVLGGGHHGTIIACYLARAGMSVGVFERAGRLGGGAATVNGPAAGFRMNPCSHWTRFYGHPAYRDFSLYDEGLRYVFPEGNEAMVFDDGTSFTGYSASRVVDPLTGRQERSDENIALTYEQIKRFSGRDAEAYLVLLDQYERYWKPAFARHRFTTPPPWGEPDALEELVTIEGSGMEPVHQFMSLQALAYDFFESPELRTLFMRAASDLYGVLRRRPTRVAGPRPQPAARAQLRARRDPDRRHAGDHRRPRVSRHEAGRASTTPERKSTASSSAALVRRASGSPTAPRSRRTSWSVRLASPRRSCGCSPTPRWHRDSSNGSTTSTTTAGSSGG